jgi:hypothetical protein
MLSTRVDTRFRPRGDEDGDSDILIRPTDSFVCFFASLMLVVSLLCNVFESIDRYMYD